MTEEKYYHIKNISKEQLNIIKDALDLYASISMLKFEDCILNDFLGKYNIEIEKYFNMLSEIRHNMVRDIPELNKYTKIERWNLGLNNKHTSDKAKKIFDMYFDIKWFIKDNELNNKLINNYNKIQILEENLRKKKIIKLLNK